MDWGIKMSMHKLDALAFGAAALLFAAVPAGAVDLQEQFSNCASKFATGHVSDAQSVMLQCTAADGKLTNCTVLEAPNPPNGYDKAALCAADYVPIGSRTGSVKVPFRFEPNH